MKNREANLSRREAEVLRRIAVGEPLKAIGRALNLSESAISTYRRRAMEKHNLATNADIVRFVERGGDESPGLYRVASESEVRVIRGPRVLVERHVLSAFAIERMDPNEALDLVASGVRLVDAQ